MQRHAGEGETIAEAIRDCLDYGKNPEKTESGKYISAYECDPATVADEFLLAKASYAAMTGREQKKANDVLCYQIRQSFYPGEITPKEANRIGYELAMRWTKGRHAFIVTTHTDKQHIHCHIYYNSTTLDCTRKFRNFWGSSFALRRLSDRLFQEYDVEFVSSTEKFDTSTPMGRAMLNICIVFAQLERETIQKRVTDAYYSRCLKGFHMSGQAPYGYQLEPTVVEGIRTKKMVADPVAADHVRLMFEMYAEPETSFGDITRYFEEQGIKIYEKSMVRSFLSQLLRNPVYAQADLELYEFFKSQGAAIVNDASDFAGTNGCYLYQGRDVKEDKDRCLKDQILVIAPHEALIPSDTWLKCRKKLMANTTFQQGRKPKNTWLAGKIKCGHCGYALKATHVPNSTGYFRCTKRTENKGCPGCGKIRKEEFEQFIFSAMQEKFKDFQILHGQEEKVNPKLTAYQVELAQVEAEIEKLLDTLTGANATLLAYANKKIEELDTRRQTISKAIADLSVETISPQQIKKLSYYLDNWESIDFDDKRKAADGLISTIKATSDRVQIEWKI